MHPLEIVNRQPFFGSEKPADAGNSVHRLPVVTDYPRIVISHDFVIGRRDKTLLGIHQVRPLIKGNVSIPLVLPTPTWHRKNAVAL